MSTTATDAAPDAAPVGAVLFTMEDDHGIGVEYRADIVTLAWFEANRYDDALLAGAAFTGPDGVEYVLVSPVPAHFLTD